MIEYFTPIYSFEHFLSASEIAEKYGIVTINNKPHVRLIKLLIANNITNYSSILQRPVFYHTKKGMMRVYSVHLYDGIISDFKNKSSLIEKELKAIEMIDGTKKVNFKYKIIK